MNMFVTSIPMHVHVRCNLDPTQTYVLLYILHIHMQASAPAPPPRRTSRSLPSIRDIHTTNSYMYNADERVFFCATHHLFSALALPLRAEVFSCDRQLLKMCGTMHYSDIRSFCLQIAAMIICIYLLTRCCPVFPFGRSSTYKQCWDRIIYMQDAGCVYSMFCIHVGWLSSST